MPIYTVASNSADISLPSGGGNALALTENSLRQQSEPHTLILISQAMMFQYWQDGIWLLKLTWYTAQSQTHKITEIQMKKKRKESGMNVVFLTGEI